MGKLNFINKRKGNTKKRRGWGTFLFFIFEKVCGVIDYIGQDYQADFTGKLPLKTND
jgi:hypothetical protein